MTTNSHRDGGRASDGCDTRAHPRFPRKARSFFPVSFDGSWASVPAILWQVNVRDGIIMPTPPKKRPQCVQMVTHPLTGLPALSAGKSAPVLTSKEVEELLETLL